MYLYILYILLIFIDQCIHVSNLLWFHLKVLLACIGYILLAIVMLAFTNLWRCQILASTTTKPSSFLVLRNYCKEPIPVTWEKPRVGWTKLNFDGSSKGKSGKASIGGVIRNHKAEFLLGFVESTGEANSTIAKVTDLRRGLEFVLENGWSSSRMAWRWCQGNSWRY